MLCESCNEEILGRASDNKCWKCYMRSYYYKKKGLESPPGPPKQMGRIPDCHPDHKHKAHGLCEECYIAKYHQDRNSIRKSSYPTKPKRIPTCHPDKPYAGRGLCRTCYNQLPSRQERIKAYRQMPAKRFADCHPDRPHHARGLCSQCYKKEPDRAQKIRDYTKATIESRREYMLNRRYGISVEQYESLLAQQNGLCAICQEPPRGRTKRLYVDHNHSTGEVWGLLCITCNRHLGFHENPTWRAQADAYLKTR